MSKKYVLVVDSGIGGLFTLNKIKELLPNENYLYFMDAVNSPYGNKSKKKLLKITEQNFIKLFRFFDIKAVVLACNTLSSVCYDYLIQKYFNVPFIKIEPCVGTKYLSYGNTLVLATKSTLKNNKDLKQFHQYKNIYFKGFGNLAKKIDGCKGNYNLLQAYIFKKLKKFRSKNIKNIVLGCTHFNFIINQIESVFDCEINFFEGSEIVAKKTYNVLKYSSKKRRSKKCGETLIIKKI